MRLRLRGDSPIVGCLDAAPVVDAQHLPRAHPHRQQLEAQRAQDAERRRRTRECVICMEADIQVVFVPCGHIVCCASCAEHQQACPTCRADIVQRVRTYLGED